MRRLLYWYIPVSAAAVFSAVLGYGFYLGVRGHAGQSITRADDSLPHTSAQRGPLVILVLGDSLARGAGDQSGLGIAGRLDAELKQRHIAHDPPVNLAVNGAHTAELIAQLKSTNVKRLIQRADVIVLSIGGNDLFGEAAAQNPQRQPIPTDTEALLDRVESRMGEVVAALRKENAQGRVAVIGLYDPFASRPYGAITSKAVAEWNARLLRHFDSDRNVTIVPTFDLFAHHEERLSYDHFHPAADGYALIARRIAESL